MNKSVLIIDTPNKCLECSVINYCLNKDREYDLSIRQEWCPLLSLPERKNLASCINSIGTGNIFQYNYSQGWNDCLDKLQDKN